MRDRLRAIADFIIDSYQNDPDLMKVIIVEVPGPPTRSGGRTSRDPPGLRRDRRIVAHGQEDGTFRSDISADFATLCFYGAIEQLLTAWIFDELPKSDSEFEQAKQVLVETICDGLAVRSGVSASFNRRPGRVDRALRVAGAHLDAHLGPLALARQPSHLTGEPHRTAPQA